MRVVWKKKFLVKFWESVCVRARARVCVCVCVCINFLHVGTKHFYWIIFWTEISLIYLQQSADYFIIASPSVHNL